MSDETETPDDRPIRFYSFGESNMDFTKGVHYVVSHLGINDIKGGLPGDSRQPRRIKPRERKLTKGDQ